MWFYVTSRKVGEKEWTYPSFFTDYREAVKSIFLAMRLEERDGCLGEREYKIGNQKPEG